jgi:spermidine/putrescine transport system substrate-binding protein
LPFLSLLLLALVACDSGASSSATLPSIAATAGVPPAATLVPSQTALPAATKSAATATTLPTAAPTDSRSAQQIGKELFVLNLDNRIDPDLYDDFFASTGITVTEATYSFDDDLYDALQSAAGNIDLIVASDRAIATLRGRNRLARLETAKISNWPRIDARLKNLPFDPGNQVSIPFDWGTIGFMVRTDRVSKAADSWNAVLSAQSPAGTQAALLDDPRMGVGAALKLLGLSLNSRNAAEIKKAGDLLVVNKKKIATIDSAAWSDQLLTGDLTLAQVSSDDAAFTQSTNANIRYVIPREGAPLWVDSFALPAEGGHREAALALIDYLLRPEIAARLSAYTYALSPVSAAYDKMDTATAALFRSGYLPDDAAFKKLELITDAGPAQTDYDKIWETLQK